MIDLEDPPVLDYGQKKKRGKSSTQETWDSESSLSLRVGGIPKEANIFNKLTLFNGNSRNEQGSGMIFAKKEHSVFQETNRAFKRPCNLAVMKIEHLGTEEKFEKRRKNSSTDSLIVIDTESDTATLSSDSSLNFLEFTSAVDVKSEQGEEPGLRIYPNEEGEENFEKDILKEIAKGKKKRVYKKNVIELDEPPLKEKIPKGRKKNLKEKQQKQPRKPKEPKEMKLAPSGRRKGGRRKKVDGEPIEGGTQNFQEEGHENTEKETTEQAGEEENKNGLDEELDLNEMVNPFNSEEEWEEICLKSDTLFQMNGPQTRAKPKQEGLLLKKRASEMTLEELEGFGVPNSYQRYIFNKKRPKITKNEKMENNFLPFVAKALSKRASSTKEIKKPVDTCSAFLREKIKFQLAKRIFEKMPIRALEETCYLEVPVQEEEEKKGNNEKVVGEDGEEVEPGEEYQEGVRLKKIEVTGKEKIEMGVSRFVEALAEKRMRASVQPLFFFYEAGFRKIPWSRLTEKENQMLFESGAWDGDPVGFFDYLFQKYIDAAHTLPNDKRFSRKSVRIVEDC